MKKPTMRDIGKAVGVSAVTVSKALAGKAGMSDKIRRRIQTVAEEMGYEYPSGEKVRRRLNLDIGILIPDQYFQSDSFYSVLYKRLVQKLAESSHFGLLELLNAESEASLALPNLIRSHRVDGMILLGQPSKEYYRMMAQQETPVVFLDFYDEHGSADSVVGDNTYGCYRLTSHLIRNGHKKIGFVGNYRVTSSIMDRYLGFYRAMLLADLPIREDWIIPDRQERTGLIDLALPEELPTAFVCNCDLVAQKLIGQLEGMGLRVPEDISVTGYDDFSVGETRGPALSTFRVDTESMIELAVKMIVDRCSGLKKPFGRTVVSGQPIYRDSEKVLK